MNRFGVMGLAIGMIAIYVTTGCQSPEAGYLYPAQLSGTPSTQVDLIDKNPGALGPRFSFISAGKIFPRPQLNSTVLENALQFEVKSRLETRGYTYTSDPSNADFLMVVDGQCSYSSPGPTSGFSGGATYGSRNYRGGSLTDTPIPLDRPLNVDPKVSYSENLTIPGVTIIAFDSHSRRKIWTGFGVGGAKNFDLRIAGQRILDRLIQAFPEPTSPRTPNKLSEFGLQLEVYTVDGGNYWPVATRVEKGSHAEAEGIAPGDVFLSLDGESVRGLSMGDIFNKVSNHSESPVLVKFWRMGRGADQEVTLTH